ncbi:ABC transporter ATP-binding protein [Corticibacterium sp. UT-5YL-CI-8]|nr:ABC transporter ATP-binding protein [Tianweitania sp. UT-5YL-CI-8]
MLAVEHLQKTFPAPGGTQTVQALKDVSCRIEKGDFFALLGPSGCGKTTLLQSIAGLETPDGGVIRIDDAIVFDGDRRVVVPANRRRLGMVFQSYAIWPHMTVYDNVAFPLVYGRTKTPAGQVSPMVMQALERVRLADYADRLTPHLSGGQQQRVALARAIVHEPRLLLLDEPLSNLDARLRDAMRVELRQLVKSLGITTVFVTHDQVEAMSMADKVAVMRSGSIVQQGPPTEVYFRPESAFVANFVGHSNTIPGRVTAVETAGDLTIRRFESPLGEILSSMPSAVGAGEAGLCIIRPQAASIAPGDQAADGSNSFAGIMTARHFLGDTVDGVFRIGDTEFRLSLGPFDTTAEGAAVDLVVPRDRCIIVPAGS